MTELKTLEDISPILTSGDDTLISKKILRMEAIKVLMKYYHPDKDTLPLHIWLDFFNITEEDLK